MMTVPFAFAAQPVSPQSFAANGVYVLVCIIATHLLRVVLLFLLGRPRAWPVFLLALAPWVLALATLSTLFILIAFEAIASTDPVVIQAGGFRFGVFDYVDNLTFVFPLFSIWSGFYLAVRHYRQQQEDKLNRVRAEAAAREAELRALKAQINPHFLFNSLNSLRALMPLDQERPRAAVTRLADLLRASLTSNQDPLIPLGQELETVENYLALEHLRHEHRLRWRIEADAEARARLVPPFLLQSLVENAVKHGIDRLESGGEIVVSGRIEATGALRLRVTSPGTLDTSAASSAAPAGDAVAGGSTGVGLANARARLALLFGPEARLGLQAEGLTRVVAEVFIPAAPKDGRTL
jgi:hypothetical protein